MNLSYKFLSKFFNKLIENIIFQLIILISALYVLFSADLECLIIPYEYHKYVIKLRDCCFILFLFELLLSILFEKKYILSLYFFMDFIDIISLVTECSILWYPFIDYLDKLSM